VHAASQISSFRAAWWKDSGDIPGNFPKKSAQLWNGQFYDVMVHAMNQRNERKSVEECRTI
jgi:hypothetical protein